MTWRRSLIYFVVLALVGGYFYYFEVVRKQQKETAEREAKRLYQVKSDDIQAVELTPKGQKPVVLEKKETWIIVQPLTTDVEKSALDSFLSTLSTLSSEATVGETVQDLKSYGLDDPGLKIRFLASGQWQELTVGDKNPVSRGYYAQVGKGTVYLINESNWSLLNKGLNELRRRTLFTFRPDQAQKIAVAWEGGSTFQVQRSNELEGSWQSPDQPALKIKASKVDNVLQQIQFLRAQNFLDEQAGQPDLSKAGLQPPHVHVTIELDGDRTVELKLARLPAEGKEKTVNAMSSELAGVVQVDSNVVKDIPKELSGLEDRSLVSARSTDVKQVQWRLGESTGSLTNIEANKWRLKIGDGEVREPKESWRVNSFLWELQQTEFSKRIDPPAPKPEKPYAQIEIDTGGKKTGLIWEKSARGDPQTMQVWVEGPNGVECVEVGSGPLKKVEEEIHTLLTSAQQQS
ncbi:MAG: DUF4340 domain-containing protein [Syntrophobacteraceae bacterium]